MAGMDYGSLLQLAQKTSEMKQAKRSGHIPPVNLSKENKNAEEEKKKLLNSNIAKFLAKRDDEERKKKLEANAKRDGLLALRNQDSKARKRVKIMNKSAKSANRSVIDDAGGSSDYYVIEEPLCFMSQESLVQEEKFLEKLSKIPKEEIFSKKKANVNCDLNSTKDRVKMALLLGDTLEKKEKRETKEKLKESNLKEKSKSYVKFEEQVEDEPKEEEKAKKPRQPRPPPMNYYELLKLAEKIQQEPVREEPKEKAPELRPMSAKEKEQYLLEEASRKRKEEGWKARLQKNDKLQPSVSLQSSKSTGSSSVLKEDKKPKPIPSIPRIPKLNEKPTQENKTNFCEERKDKLYREDKSSYSNQKSYHQTEEKSSTPKPSSSNSTKYRSGEDRNFTQNFQKENARKYLGEERCSQSIKVQGTKRDKEQNNSNKSHSQQQEKISPMSHEMKEPKPKSMGSRTTPSSSDGKLHSKKPVGNSKNDSLFEKPRLQSSSTVSPNAKPGEHKPHAHMLPKKSSSEVKSKINYSSNPKQSDMPSKQPVPGSKHPAMQSRQLSSSDIKAKQHPSNAKPSSLPSSDSKLNKTMPEIKSKQPSSNLKPKQSSADLKNQQASVSSKSKLSSLSDGKPRNLPPSDGKPRNLPPSDGKRRNFPPSDSKPRNLPQSDGKPRNFPSSDSKPRNFPPSDGKPRNLPPSDGKPRNFPPTEGKPRNLPPSDGKPRNFPPSDGKPRNFPPSDGQPRKFPPTNGPKQFPPPDVRRKQFPPPDLKRKQFPPPDVRRGPKPPPSKKRRVIDSDDEYDSEVADFIDDGDDGDAEDYSKHIQEIFGYDRSKYRAIDDDDECMESSFSQQMKEEFKSTKLGILEDLEDIRREKQHEAMLKKRKKMKS